MKYLILTLCLLLLTLSIAQVAIMYNTSNTGKIPFELIKKYDNFEIRKYPELVVANTTLPADNYSNNSRLGFKRIASYIFGGNSSNSQIAMTSPVQMNIGESSSMSFFMPTDLELSQLPAPNNQYVNLQKQAAKTVAVIEFSGWASDEKLEEKFNELKSMLIQNNIQFKDNYTYLGYNPPYQLIDRRNEVIIEVNL